MCRALPQESTDKLIQDVGDSAMHSTGFESERNKAWLTMCPTIYSVVVEAVYSVAQTAHRPFGRL